MTIVSYSQNREDVLLARAFAPDHIGFYVDVGAWLPDTDSVTKLFYDRGWSGINIEPGRGAFAALSRQRPRDVNLPVAVGAADGEATFHEYEGPFAARSTLDTRLAEEYAEADEMSVHGGSTAFNVTVTTLASIFAEHVGDRVVDFLKVDVEGHERAALEGADFSRFRPRIVMVEATEPGEAIPTHGEWERLLLDADYSFATFDGLNRIYVDAAHPALAEALVVPVNVFDDYEPAALTKTRERLAITHKQLASTHEHASVLEGANRELANEGEGLQRDRDRHLDAAADAKRDAVTARTLLAETRAELATALEGNARLQERCTAAAQALAAAEGRLAALGAGPLGRLLFAIHRPRENPVPPAHRPAAVTPITPAQMTTASHPAAPVSPAAAVYDRPMSWKRTARRALGWPLRRALNPRFEAVAQEIYVNRGAAHAEAAATRELTAALERSVAETIEQHVQAVIEVGANVGDRLARALVVLERIEARLDALDTAQAEPEPAAE